MTERQTELRDNYFRVLEKIEAAKERRGEGKEVKLLAATKTVPAEDILFLTENYGLKLCGENHAQEFRDKSDAVIASGAQMDFIGHLQTNKVKYVVGKAGLIHSLDSVKLAAELDRQAKKLGVVQDVLVEINIGSEESKTGIAPTEAERFLAETAEFSSIRVCGMMTMAPKCENKSNYFKYFEETCKLVLDIWTILSHNNSEMILSMGMSESYEEAILSGATHVRIGRSIFKK